MALFLEPPPNTNEQAARIASHVSDQIVAMLSGFLHDGYTWSVEAKHDFDSNFDRHRIVARILEKEGSARPVAVFSYNWYHADAPKNAIRKMDKKFVKFVSKTRARLKQPSELKQLQAARVVRAANKARLKEAFIEKNRALLSQALDDLDQILR